MAEKQIRTELYTVKDSFLFRGSQYFMAGQVVQAGHPVLRGRASLFVPFAPDFPWPATSGTKTKTAEPEPTESAESAPEPEPEAET